MSIYEAVGERDGRRVLSLKSPVNLQTTGELICANRDDVIAAVKNARDAQTGWSALSFKETSTFP